jgi:hypothetical protein
VFKRAFAILTTLFFIAMPLQAAYGQGEVNGGSAGCVTFEQIMEPDVLKVLHDQGGYLSVVEGPQAKQVLEAVEALLGKEAPFKVSKIILVNPDGDPDGYIRIIFFGDDGCLKAAPGFPASIVRSFGEFPRTPLLAPEVEGKGKI